MNTELEEIMGKVPDGYRVATPEEEKEIFLTGMGLELSQAKVGQFSAELEAAKLNLRKALSDLQLAGKQRMALLGKLGLKDEAGYMLPDGKKRVFILTDPSKKIERLPDPTPPAASPLEKKEEKPTPTPTS